MAARVLNAAGGDKYFPNVLWLWNSFNGPALYFASETSAELLCAASDSANNGVISSLFSAKPERPNPTGLVFASWMLVELSAHLEQEKSKVTQGQI